MASLILNGDFNIRNTFNADMNLSNTLDGQLGHFMPIGTLDYDALYHKPQINGHELVGDQTGAELGLLSEADLSDALASLGIVPKQIYFDTTANWNAQTQLVSEAGIVYVYTDYQEVDGMNLAGFKVGDGGAFVIDLPFVDTLYARHIADTTIHITQEERSFWNNKNRAYIDLNDPENLILTNL